MQPRVSQKRITDPHTGLFGPGPAQGSGAVYDYHVGLCWVSWVPESHNIYICCRHGEGPAN